MVTLHSVTIGRIWKDFGKHQHCISFKLCPKFPTGFGSVDTGVTIWATGNIILGLYCIALRDSSIT